MPAAAPQPETQEEILEAALAALTEDDVPPDDDAWAVPDPDCGRPAELIGLSSAELDELLDPAAPAQPSGQSVPCWPAGPGAAAATSPAWSAPGDAPRGDGSGFAEGGVLDVLVPGVALAGFADDAHARLAGLSDDELVGVLRAWRRQASWVHARELAATAELARRRPAPGTPAGPAGEVAAQVSEFAVDEVALALTLTLRAAGAQLDLALDLAARPATAALLEAGRIDLPRARVILDGLAGLVKAHAAAVEAAVLPAAPGMTTGQLRAAVARAVLAADPDAARTQREEDLKDARVECWTDPAGTANLAGRNLPAAETLAADQRLRQVAAGWKKQIRAAWKHADPHQEQPWPVPSTDQLRARAYLALLLGQPADAPPADLLPPAGVPAPGAHPADGPAPGPAAGVLPPLAGQVCLTVPLATLLGLSDAPGQAAGYGPLDPDTARALARSGGRSLRGRLAPDYH